MGSSNAAFLKRLGLLNIDAPDLRDLQEPKNIYVPFCMSRKCCRRVDENGKTTYLSKVSRSDEKISNNRRCPYCEHVLIYKKL